jgi:thiol:disulfide interchange protein DsbA
MSFRLLSALCGLLIAFATTARAAPVEGTDYVELKPPQSVDSPGKVEVIEFFWYRCPHCYALEPDLEAWVKRLPRDVQFKRIPGVLNEDWAVDAKVFYALEAIGEVERLHRALFNAIHQPNGGATRLRDAALNSFTVASKLRRASQMAGAYRLDGVPAIVVQGRYLVLANTSQKAMLATADSFIGEARKQLAKAKP